jgi:hypothetical protein
VFHNRLCNSLEDDRHSATVEDADEIARLYALSGDAEASRLGSYKSSIPNNSLAPTHEFCND